MWARVRAGVRAGVRHWVRHWVRAGVRAGVRARVRHRVRARMRHRLGLNDRTGVWSWRRVRPHVAATDVANDLGLDLLFQMVDRAAIRAFLVLARFVGLNGFRELTSVAFSSPRRALHLPFEIAKRRAGRYG